MAMMQLLIGILAIFLILCYIIYRPPTCLIRYFQRRWPDILWQVSVASKVVALTIDDAPSEHTNEIMKVLKSNDATATFFIIGSQISSPALEATLREVVSNGNELGNHAMYDEPSRSLSDTTLTEHIAFVERKISKIYNLEGVEGPPNYFRPGSGFFNDRMRSNVSKLGYRLVLGSIYPHDPHIPFWRLNSWHILSMLNPGKIIVCHDRRKWTLPMLKKILPEMKRKGYRVVNVTQLLKEASN